MSDVSSWQLEAEAAEFYEANLVAALMSPWAVSCGGERAVGNGPHPGPDGPPLSQCWERATDDKAPLSQHWERGVGG